MISYNLGGGDLESPERVERKEDRMSDNVTDGSFYPAPTELDGYEGIKRRLKLGVLMNKAAVKGDWKAAEVLLRIDRSVFSQRITERGDRALHVAAAAKQTKFVRELVSEMDPEDLKLTNDSGYTAFIYAAASGIVEIAAVMREKNPRLVTICGEDKRTPIYVAVLHGNTDMVSYLEEFTLMHLSTDERFDLLLATIEKKMYDKALKILSCDESLAYMTKEKESALSLLAQHDISDISSCKEVFLKSLVSMFAPIPCLFWLKRICEQPLMQKRAFSLAVQLLDDIQGFKDPVLFHKLFAYSPVLHEAAKLGNVEFIIMLTSYDPDLIFKMDSDGYTIFHIAVLCRQEKVFSLIHKLGAMKDWITTITDDDGNNILHLAQELPDARILKNVPGAALQMQRELMWHTELKQIVPVSCLKMKNQQDKLPTQLFSENHDKLLKEGEKGMKETANSCMLTATLTATVAFAAAFTVPGGTDENTGTPILLGRTWFTLFVVSDAVAMFFSTMSITIFLAILTSRFEEDDFLKSLPTKLILGLTTLFASIVSTIFAFTSTCILLIGIDRTWTPILFASIAFSLLTVLFVRMHIKLWIDTFRSTYLSKAFLRRYNL